MVNLLVPSDMTTHNLSNVGLGNGLLSEGSNETTPYVWHVLKIFAEMFFYNFH